MDISINLLPREISAQLERKKNQKLHLTVGGIVVVALLSAYGFLAFNTVQAGNEAVRLQQERMALENQAKAYEQYAQLQARVTQADTTVRSAVGAPPHWQQIMAGIGLYIPPNVWLTDFATTLAKENKTAQTAAANNETETKDNKEAPPVPVGEVVLRGWTFDHISVAAWLEEIRQVPGLTGIRCQYSSEEEMEGQAMVKFEIKASIMPGPEYQPPQRKAGE